MIHYTNKLCIEIDLEKMFFLPYSINKKLVKNAGSSL